MSKIVLLDAGPLGMISNPNAKGPNRECYEWMEALVVGGFDVRVPEIADYEVRRELLRAKKDEGIARLDLLKNTIGYLPLTTPSCCGPRNYGHKRGEVECRPRIQKLWTAT